MVHFASIISAAALFAGFASALPRPDSAIGQEVAVSAPNGVIQSDTAELASQSAAEAASSAGGYYPAAATSMAAAMSTYAPPPAYTPPPSYTPPTSTAAAYSAVMTYGSGNSNWSGYGSGYDGCVQQCVASFGAPPATWTPSPTAASSYGSGSSGSGSTITVVVAPTQGVLRYVPFAVNASVGDTVRFVWHANNHTVTKSSQLEICNKTSDAPFASGTQNQGFTFDQVVNDTSPTFFYCGTPTHCQKGMFGIINPPASFGANTTVGNQMQNIIAANPQLSAMSSYTNSVAASNPQANNWATNMDIGQMPSWSYPYIAENVYYTRTFLAQNPDVIQSDGSINMNTNAPLMFPQDISAVSDAAAASSSSSAAPSAATANNAAASSPSASATMAPSSNGARSTAVSGGILAIAALAATFLAL